MDKRYIQLYSLKDETAKDFKKTLQRVKDIGYTGVEFAGDFGGLSAAELKAFLAEVGLEALGCHVMSPMIPNMLDFAAELGVKYLIDPLAMINTYEDAVSWAEKFNEAGKLCADRGIRFGYHNHRHEFLPGKDGYLLETVLLNTDPAHVCLQLDVGWAACAGVDPVGFINKHAGRVKLIHLKECSHVAGAEAFPDLSQYPKGENGRPQIPPEIIEAILAQLKWNAPAGKGIINWTAVRDAAIAQGAEGFIVEREYDYAGDIWKCVEEDHSFIQLL
ncbi:MAG: sugar phosphate isomerase/epimerase [Defluviitaleaceae bacterium]|nr:sugar phosphate isomerase/epimerase [Defluviitaleaceae bacterium]